MTRPLRDGAPVNPGPVQAGPNNGAADISGPVNPGGIARDTGTPDPRGPAGGGPHVAAFVAERKREPEPDAATRAALNRGRPTGPRAWHTRRPARGGRR